MLVASGVIRSLLYVGPEDMPAGSNESRGGKMVEALVMSQEGAMLKRVSWLGWGERKLFHNFASSWSSWSSWSCWSCGRCLTGRTAAGPDFPSSFCVALSIDLLLCPEHSYQDQHLTSQARSPALVSGISQNPSLNSPACVLSLSYQLP